MERHERRLLEFLSRPGSYPHPVRLIEHRESHISHVFLAGHYAYKLKKPVRFPFLDASTLPLRLKWCRLELKLNRRLAPDLYLGLVPVAESGGRLQLGGKGKVVEWLVKMRRLPEDRMLDVLVRKGKITAAEVEQAAGCLARFFKTASLGRSGARYASPEQVGRLFLKNFEECRPLAARLVRHEDMEFIARAFKQFLLLEEPLLQKRVEQGRIIDGHGDLRCENVCMTDPVTVFDCVEFEPLFRCGDAMNDLSFLLMDLEFRGRPDLARAALKTYLACIPDPDALRLLPFYQCYRSLVRGKVRALAWQQNPNSARGRKLRELARRHFLLARHYAHRFHRPLLLVTGGTIGTGKSALARRLSEALDAAWLRTDEIRRKNFRRFRRPREGFSQGLYAPAVSRMVYRRMLGKARDQLREGRSVICDGTFSKAAGRQELRDMAAKHGARFHFFECTVPRGTAMRRVRARLARGRDLSEARPEYYDRLKGEFEPERRMPPGERTVLSTAGSPQSTFRNAIRALRKNLRV